MALKRQLPDVGIEQHGGKQCLTVDGKIKIVADKILRYALFDDGAKIAVLFKDEDNDNHLKGINLMTICLDKDESDMALLEPQPASESEEDIFFIGERRNKKITVCFKAGSKKFYYLRSDTLEITGPFDK